MIISNEIRVSASADRAWEVLAENFGDAALWTSALNTSSLTGDLGVGAIRTCHSNKIGPFPANISKEILTEFDPRRRRFTYKVQSGLPGIFKGAQNAWSIESISHSSCIVKSRAVLELSVLIRPLSCVLSMLIKRDLKKIFEELHYYIEHNSPHPNKEKLNKQTVKT